MVLALASVHFMEPLRMVKRAFMLASWKRSGKCKDGEACESGWTELG